MGFIDLSNKGRCTRHAITFQLYRIGEYDIYACPACVAPRILRRKSPSSHPASTACKRQAKLIRDERSGVIEEVWKDATFGMHYASKTIEQLKYTKRRLKGHTGIGRIPWKHYPTGQ